jgi:hypothetical protein
MVILRIPVALRATSRIGRQRSPRKFRYLCTCISANPEDRSSPTVDWVQVLDRRYVDKERSAVGSGHNICINFLMAEKSLHRGV